MPVPVTEWQQVVDLRRPALPGRRGGRVSGHVVVLSLFDHDGMPSPVGAGHLARTGITGEVNAQPAAVADRERRLITTLTSFATAVDVTLSELLLEAFLPADEATARILASRRSGVVQAFP
jgi:hypothetical protein